MMAHAAGAPPFEEYLSKIDAIDGWLSNGTARISHAVMLEQSRRDIHGNICEIGVHHGRYFIALAIGLRSGERGIAVDLFEAQEENIDRSGLGDRAQFEANVRRFLDPAAILAIQGNSTRMSAADITRHGPVRFFSIDGGHTQAITLNDLRIAEEAICAGGVVALDDILSSHWCGVISGLADYKHHGGTLAAFALVPNKLLLCKSGDVARYRAFMTASFGSCLEKSGVEMMGDVVDVFGEPSPPPHAAAAPSSMPDDTERLKRELEALQVRLDRVLSSRRYRLGTAIANAYNRLRLSRSA